MNIKVDVLEVEEDHPWRCYAGSSRMWCLSGR